MKEYIIQKVSAKPTDWEMIPKAEIDYFGWVENDYRPRVFARLCYDSEAIYIKFWAYEDEVRGEHKTHEEGVCEDSCVEFFFCPDSKEDFLNIETNCLGCQLIGLGKDRYVRKDIPVDEDLMQISTSVSDPVTYHDEFWTAEYRVPFSFIKEQFDGADVIEEGMRGNLFKCGDLTKYEHYGMWNPNLSPTPDYHLPEYFGKFIFEK